MFLRLCWRAPLTVMRSIGRKIDARIGELFSTIPKTKLEIRPVPAYREKGDAGAYHEPGSADGSRPSGFFFNTYDLPSRTTLDMESIYLHEAVPGHHFQISLTQENKALPNFLRFGSGSSGGNSAYVEGWAFYCETLWDELGMETDRYHSFGGVV